MKFMYKIAVVGDKNSIYGFAALGMDVFPADDETQAEQKIKQLAKNDFGIIFITEELADKLRELLDDYRFKAAPAIIQIPGVKGNSGSAQKELGRTVEKAIGSNILETGGSV